MTQETLNDRDVDSLSLLWRTALMVLTFITTIVLVLALIRYSQTFEPYVHEVLSLEGNSQRGAAIFQMNCAVCHGIQATGEVGPNLVGVSERRSKVSLINQVISGKTPPMPQFQPNPQDMADLLEYLETL